jgi:hypothetical protein
LERRWPKEQPVLLVQPVLLEQPGLLEQRVLPQVLPWLLLLLELPLPVPMEPEVQRWSFRRFRR